MRLTKRIRLKFEAPLVRLGLAIIPRLPRQAVVTLANFAAKVAYPFLGKMRRIGHANLDLAYGSTKSYAEKEAILRQSFRTFSLVILDLIWFVRDSQARINKYVHFDASYDHIVNDNVAEICLTAHHGNWELFGRAISMHGQQLTSIAAPLANPAVGEIFNQLRMDTGQTIVSKIGALRKLITTLKGNGKVAILLDQNTRPYDGGVFVNFFGRPTPISTIVAALCLHTKCLVAFGSCLPDRQGHYYCTPIVKLSWPQLEGADKEERQRKITQEIAQTMEARIRERPEHWLWMYKRWKYIAPGYEAWQYPFYSHPLGDRDLEVLRKRTEAEAPAE